MNFVSIQYFVFLAAVVAMWNLLPFATAKRMLLAAGLLFYAYWFPPHLLVLLSVSCVTFVCAKNIGAGRSPKLWLAIDLIFLLSGLFFFKYYNFFLDSFGGAASASLRLDIILPLGISFYTFQNIGYAVDVFRGKLKPFDNPVDFFLGASFFASIQAGPIVRLADLAPQLKLRTGLTHEDIQFVIYRFSRGFFLKTVVANNLSKSVSALYRGNPDSLSMTQAWCAAIFFSIQIFCDFAGYSDIALASARLLGIRIKENFNNPYLATSLADFWRRWHISLTTWFRDYLYVALGGNRVSKFRTYLNIAIVFLVSGLWHGANWTFIFWGFIHGAGLIAERLLKTIAPIKNLSANGAMRALYRAGVVVVVAFAWVPFNCQTIGQALGIWERMLSFEGFSGSAGVGIIGMVTSGIFVIYQLNEALKEKLGGKISFNYLYLESIVYALFVALLRGDATDFIYFQF